MRKGKMNDYDGEDVILVIVGVALAFMVGFSIQMVLSSSL
jgi:hypothetical protein